MNKKTITIIITIVLILVIIFPLISYAVNITDKVKIDELFVADKTEASVGDTVILTLDLSKIDYDDFEFTLSSNSGVNDVTVAEETINTERSGNEFVITGNKSKLSVDKISLSYVVPENAAVGTKIDLKGSIKNIGLNLDDEENEDNTGTSQEETNNIEAKEITITIKVVEKTSDEQSDKSEDKNNEEKKTTTIKNNQ